MTKLLFSLVFLMSPLAMAQGISVQTAVQNLEADFAQGNFAGEGLPAASRMVLDIYDWPTWPQAMMAQQLRDGFVSEFESIDGMKVWRQVMPDIPPDYLVTFNYVNGGGVQTDNRKIYFAVYRLIGGFWPGEVDELHYFIFDSNDNLGRLIKKGVLTR